ncbi:tRNA lysidine(34) synthetase TilS [Oryzibacter oryziterrae]|uniref:tRNA lysidine(34) synthetase TilS n=1 Tax=Oryzibacter oryziterrae TaxID=2766474 RepID=UPI00272CA1F6|nr:tRNA lysidine(34) synthetase TilS [Oryzibacter oryziterrae]
MARRPTSDTAFTVAETDQLFSAFSGLSALGIAVSGGPDSTALMTLLADWARRQVGGPRLHVFTVDHGLRPESASEAQTVVAQAEALGLTASALTWQHDGPPPASDIQARARAARYALIAAEAHRLAIPAVALAHTLDDQAETFLMRLQRGSGVAGLSAMPAERRVDGIRFLRPLLGVPKSRLLAFLASRGLTAIDDPSNRRDRFLRVRLRQLLPDLAAAGLDAETLAATAARMARADAALESATDQLAHLAATDHGGVISVDRAALSAAPDEIALRLMVRCLRAVRPAPYPPRAEALERWHAALRTGELPKRATMAGVTVTAATDRIWFYAEAGRIGFEVLLVATPGPHVWDGRLEVTLSARPDAPVAIGPATGEHRRSDLPKAAAASLPCILGDAPPSLGLLVRPLAPAIVGTN